MNNQLSTNFDFYELTNTSHLDLLDQNREEADAYVGNLTSLATYILQPLRDFLGKPITVSSGYRGESLNNAVGGSKTSQHSYGEAADISVDGMSVKELFNFVKENQGIFAGHLAQCILEQVGQSEWVHISFKSERYKQILVDRYGSDDSVFLATVDGKNYERVV